MTMTRRAYSLLEVKSVNEDKRIIRGIATTPSVDRMGDVVEPLGVKFANPMPFLWQHDASKPIGTVKFDKPTKNGITFEAELPTIDEPGTLKDRVDEAWQSIKLGLVRAVSIGFRAIEYAFIEGGNGMRFIESEVYELSAVTIPAQPDAVMTSIKNMDAAGLAVIKQFDIGAPAIGQRADGDKGRKATPGVSGTTTKTVKLVTPKEKTMATKTIEDQISSYEATAVAKTASAEAIMDAAVEAGETLDAEKQEEYDGLIDEAKACKDHVKRLRELQAVKAASAKPVEVKADAVKSDRPTIKVVNNLEKGVEFARYVKCLAASRGNTMQALEFAKQHYPEMTRVHNVIKAAVNAGTTTDPTWAAPLVDYQGFAGDFIEFLRPSTILGKFGTDGIPSLFRVPFNVEIPAQTSGGDAYWVGEGAPKPLTKFDFTKINLRWAKVANIAVLTDELVRFSNPSADLLVRNALADAIRERLDKDFVDPAKAAVANVSPASITNGVAGTASSGDMETDLDVLNNAFITANLSTANAVLIMSEILGAKFGRSKNPLGQREYANVGPRGGSIEGIPVITSQYIPAGMIAMVAADQIYLADDGQVVIDASREASLQMDNAPTNASNPATATPLVSMWQTNSVAIRAERYINWQKRRANAVAVITGATYPVVPAGG